MIGIKEQEKKVFFFTLSFWRWHTGLLSKEYPRHGLQDPAPGYTSVHMLALFLLLHMTMKGSEIWTTESRRNLNSSVGKRRRHSPSRSHPRLPNLKWAWFRAAQEFVSWNKLEFWSLHQSGHLNYWEGPSFWLHRAPAHLGTAETRSSSGVS